MKKMIFKMWLSELLILENHATASSVQNINAKKKLKIINSYKKGGDGNSYSTYSCIR